MGHAFASNLLKEGFTVHGWNRTPNRGEDQVTVGLNLHTTPQQAVASSEVILSALTDGDAILDLIRQIAANCKKVSVYCQMDTIGVEETQEAMLVLNSLCPSVNYLDAPVSGTKKTSRERTDSDSSKWRS